MKLTFGIIRTVLLLVLLIAVSCDKSESKSPKRYEDFEVVKRLNIPHTENAWIMRDKETGVLYLYVQSFYHDGGLTRYYEKDEK